MNAYINYWNRSSWSSWARLGARIKAGAGVGVGAEAESEAGAEDGAEARVGVEVRARAKARARAEAKTRDKKLVVELIGSAEPQQGFWQSGAILLKMKSKRREEAWFFLNIIENRSKLLCFLNRLAKLLGESF